MKKRFLMLVAAAVICVLAVPCVQAKTVFRVNHTLDPTSHYHQGLLYLDKLLKERTNGELTLDVYHSSQLGSERDAIEGVTIDRKSTRLNSSH